MSVKKVCARCKRKVQARVVSLWQAASAWIFRRTQARPLLFIMVRNLNGKRSGPVYAVVSNLDIY